MKFYFRSITFFSYKNRIFQTKVRKPLIFSPFLKYTLKMPQTSEESCKITTFSRLLNPSLIIIVFLFYVLAAIKLYHPNPGEDNFKKFTVFGKHLDLKMREISEKLSKIVVFKTAAYNCFQSNAVLLKKNSIFQTKARRILKFSPFLHDTRILRCRKCPKNRPKLRKFQNYCFQSIAFLLLKIRICQPK